MSVPASELWWLSFADGRLPPGTQFLGACWVRATDFGEAVQRTHELGINPGGEVAGWSNVDSTLEVDDSWVERLLTREECEAADGGDLWTRPRIALH